MDETPTPGQSAETYCDIVMKGGITSGIIYPKLVAKLASEYHFKNIGGTSAGAIAAAACAAAEFGRRHGRSDSFAELEKLPELLSETTPPSGRSRLFTLFQPAENLREHFDAMVGALNASPREAICRVVFGMLKMHPGLVMLGILAASLVLWPFIIALAPGANLVGTGVAALGAALWTIFFLIAFPGVLARGRWLGLALGLAFIAVPSYLAPALLGEHWSLRLTGTVVSMEVVSSLFLAFLLLAVAMRFATTLLRGLHGNGYGMCSGRTSPTAPPDQPGLTDWLADYLDKLAGLPEADRPLTFGDLWGSANADAPRDINLEVMTSAVSQQMIYSIPFREGSLPFYYDPEEWNRLFPPKVMEWLEKASQPTPKRNGGDTSPGSLVVTSEQGWQLRALPQQADLPVVVAVRMSLSFPILLSAVPLYAIDWTRTANQKTSKDLRASATNPTADAEPIVATRIWFSDGGIGSNMPLHMFDDLLPEHPTFAVNLKAKHPDFEIQTPERPDNKGGRIYLPDDNCGGRLRYWPAPADEQPLGGLLGFVRSIVDTMQNWRDEIAFPYPGYRDRIVQISQRPDEGGLNLDMPESTIKALANAGHMAAGRLIDRFHPNGAEQGAGWKNHQTVRLGTFLGVMQPASKDLQPSLANHVWTDLVSSIKGYGPNEQKLAVDFLNELQRLGSLSTPSGSTLKCGALKPIAQIRISPRI